MKMFIRVINYGTIKCCGIRDHSPKKDVKITPMGSRIRAEIRDRNRIILLLMGSFLPVYIKKIVVLSDQGTFEVPVINYVVLHQLMQDLSAKFPSQFKMIIIPVVCSRQESHSGQIVIRKLVNATYWLLTLHSLVPPSNSFKDWRREFPSNGIQSSVGRVCCCASRWKRRLFISWDSQLWMLCKYHCTFCVSFPCSM